MATMSADPPVAVIRQMIEIHGTPKVVHALVGALVSRRRVSRAAVPENLRTDVGLPPVEREMRRSWEIR